MTDRPDGEVNRPVADAAVSRRYRELSREHTPEALDRRILEQARRKPAPSPRWRPALAIAATLTLSLALVLSVTRQAPVPQDGIERSRDTAAIPGSAAQDAAAPPVAAERRSFRPQAQEAVSDLGRASEMAAEALGESDIAATPGDCAAQTHDLRAWRRCIEALEAEGAHEAAAREWAALRQRYPESQHEGD